MKYKKIALIPALYLKVFFCIPCMVITFHLPAQKVTPGIQGLDSYIENAIKDWNIPGLAIHVVKNDSTFFSGEYGIREHGKKGLINDQTVFAIASNTKAFTTSALAILVDRNFLTWDTKIKEIMPRVVFYDPYVTSNATVRDLLCHRIGFKTFSGDLVWYGTTHTRKEIIHRIRYLMPEYSFRSAYGYSNLMYMIAGEIIPEMTGYSWDQFVKENFFVPLNMNLSFTSVDDLNMADNVATPHFIDKNGKVNKISYVNWDNIGPAGSILSCSKDMAEWIKFQLRNGSNNGHQVISEENIWEMRSATTPITLYSEYQVFWASTHFKAYGLGWYLYDYHGKKIVEHGGGADGMISKVVMVPEENLGFVILTNCNNYLPTALTYYILDMLYGKDHKDWSRIYHNFYKKNLALDEKKWQEFLSVKPEKALPVMEIEKYTGIYSSELYGEVSVRLEDNTLTIDMIPTPMFKGKLKHFYQHTFLIDLLDVPSLPTGSVNFKLDKFGVPEEMVIDIPNPDFDFTELKLTRIKNKN